MRRIRFLWVIAAFALLASSVPAVQALPSAPPVPPDQPIKLIFIHHSSGENWLADGDGGLGLALRNNHYFVSDTNYGWGPDGIGDRTDIGHWWTWFRGADRSRYLAALYAESGQHSSYSRMAADPGGENRIVLFKSCFPNSHLDGKPDAPPTIGANPLRGQGSGSEYMTVAHAKGIYNDLLVYFATRQDKLFIAITAPPLVANATDPTHAANARAFNNWLVNDWLDGYAHKNVAVFDFYNVLTSNGGDRHTNDLGSATGNHHRWRNGRVEHTQTALQNASAYGADAGGSHPTAAGSQKATAEFVPVLNYWVAQWRGNGAAPSPVYLPAILATQSQPQPTLEPGTDRLQPADLTCAGAIRLSPGFAEAYINRTPSVPPSTPTSSASAPTTAAQAFTPPISTPAATSSTATMMDALSGEEVAAYTASA